MTTAINPFDSQTNHWPATINWANIVAFDLPSRRYDIGQQTPHGHPWLVVDVNDIVGARYMTLAPGNAIGKLPHRSQEILVARSEALKSAGLQQPMIFNCRGLVLVSVSNKGLVLNSTGTPIIGRLVGEERHYLNNVRARLQAFSDMKTIRRSDRKRKLQSATHSVASNRSGPAILAPMAIKQNLGR
ncbi:hypothetical protein [Cohaesibacter intestini]|uniref:hypothetical protein n=1 Tax=Cohaesibacter intestini TaxID=2211145 RepID=UPI000DE9A64F|nr:hypothetical protein [Cohaesibacter intestini]